MKNFKRGKIILVSRRCLRGQGIIEFMILFGAILLFFVGFLIIIQNNVAMRDSEKERIVAQNILLSVQDEIALAHETTDGYYREFSIPTTLIGSEYNITLIEDRLQIDARKIGISYKVLDYTGTVVKGSNAIRKEGGIVYVNT